MSTAKRIDTMTPLPVAQDDKAQISNVKIEKGNIPTDWSPAPEDIMGGDNLLPYIAERRCAA